MWSPFLWFCSCSSCLLSFCFYFLGSIVDSLGSVLWASWWPVFWLLHQIGLISLSLSSFSGVLFCSFIWAIFLCVPTPVMLWERRLRYTPGRGNPLCCVVALSVEEGSEREQCCSLAPLYPHFPMNSPMRLGVLPAVTTPTVFYSKFWVFSFLFSQPHFTHVVHCLAEHPLYLAVHLPSPPLLPVWVNVSLTPRLSEFHAVWFSGTSGWLLFLNWLLSFFWLCEEGKHFYLCLHLVWNSP